MIGPPTVFISYSWDSEDHKSWVRELAERLVLNGVPVKLDQWDVVLGDSLTEFMEAQIEACDFVLVICTPNYAKKSTARTGGVGYEQQIISGSLASGVERRKFIPIVRSGEMKTGPDEAVPPHFRGVLAVDMRGSGITDNQLEALLRAIFKVPAVSAPALGAPPKFAQVAAGGSQNAKPQKPARLAVIGIEGWHLISGVAMNEHHPETFHIPDATRRAKVIPGDYVKLGFEILAEDPEAEDGDTTIGERMWVEVKGGYGPYLWGVLSNHPSFDGADISLEYGSEIVFLPEHILSVMDAEQQRQAEEEVRASVQNAKSES